MKSRRSYIRFKPRRAKCTECGNGMIQKSGVQKYCASCRRVVERRQTYDSAVRMGKIKNPGMGDGWFKPRRAKCHECGKGMIQKHASQKYHASCAKTAHVRTRYERNIITGEIKNPGAGSHGRGEDNSNWKYGARPWQIREFRGTECERCGSKGQMHLHHRDRDWRNWKKGNLETLCVPCHQEEHRNDEGPEQYAAA